MSRRMFHVLAIWLAIGVSGAASDPFVGTWKLNPSRSTLIDRLKIENAGGNKYAFYFSGGTEAETVVADGTDQPVRFGTTLAVIIERPDTWKVVRKKEGRTVLTATWKLSENGETFHDAMAMNQPDGSTFEMNFVYKRTAAGSGFGGTWESTSMQVNSAFELQIQPYEGDGLSIIIPAEQRTQNLKFDGKEYPDLGPNMPAGAASSARRVSERSLEKTDKINGKVVETMQFTLSSDLKTLTLTMRPAERSTPNILVFERQ